MQHVSVGGLFDSWLALEELKAMRRSAAKQSANEPQERPADDRTPPADPEPHGADRDHHDREAGPVWAPRDA